MFDNLKRLASNTFGKAKAVIPSPETIANAEMMTDIAWSNSNLYSGKDFPKYNPDDLMQRRGVKVYKKMMQDEQIKAVVRFKRDAITSRAWQFKCEHDELSDEENVARCKIFEKAVCNMEGSFSDSLNNIMSAMYMGFSLTEKVFKLNLIDDKSWYGVDHLRLKPHESFFFYLDEFGTVTALKQRMYGTEKEIDQSKFIHFVQNPEWDLQYGKSELRECYRAWFSKDMIIKFQNIHMERFAGGFIWARPVAGKTLNTGTIEYNNLQEVLTNIHTKTSMIVPANIDLNVVQGATTDIFEKAITQHNNAIAKSLLVPQLLGISEMQTRGGQSQADSQLEAFFWTLEADTARLEDCLNEQLFRDLGDLNWGDGLYPEGSFAPISEKTKMLMISTWKDLVTSGAVEATDTDEEYLRELMDFPDKGTPLKAVPSTVPGGQIPGGSAGTAPIKGDIQAAEETIVGKMDITIGAFRAAMHKAFGYKDEEDATIGKQGIAQSAFSRAMKRVDFAVIANQSDNSSQTTAYDVAVENSAAVARIVSGITDTLTLTDVPKFKFNAEELGKMKASVAAGLKESWAIGTSHARRELAKASRQRKFDVGDLTLNELAAEYVKTRSFTMTGSISGQTQGTIQNILMEGIKNSKSGEEMRIAIFKALESDGLLTDEAVQEALGTTTVKDTKARIQTIVRTNSFEAINEARYKIFSDPALDGFVEALEYSSVLDDRTTDICNSLNGDIYPIDDEVWQTYTPPNHYNSIVGGEKVYTRKGSVAIEHVCVGDEVMTHEGRFKPVYAVMSKPNDTDFARELKLSTGGSLRVTDEHPILTLDGWKRADEVLIGDKLFQRSEQTVKTPFSVPTKVAQGVLLDAHNRKPLVNEPSIAYQVGSFTRGVSSAIQFKIDATLKNKVEYVRTKRDLDFIFDTVGIKRSNHTRFVPRRSLFEGIGATLRGLVANCTTDHWIAISHSLGAYLSQSCRRFLVMISPMPSRFIPGDRRLTLASHGNPVIFAETGNLVSGNSCFFGNREDGFAKGNVMESDEFNSQHGKPHGWTEASIISNVIVNYNGKVFNLAVEDDETFMASNVLVHNCRSLLIPVTQRDTWQSSDPPTVDPQKGFGFTKLERPDHSTHSHAQDDVLKALADNQVALTAAIAAMAKGEKNFAITIDQKQGKTTKTIVYDEKLDKWVMTEE